MRLRTRRSLLLLLRVWMYVLSRSRRAVAAMKSEARAGVYIYTGAVQGRSQSVRRRLGTARQQRVASKQGWWWWRGKSQRGSEARGSSIGRHAGQADPGRGSAGGAMRRGPRGDTQGISLPRLSLSPPAHGPPTYARLLLPPPGICIFGFWPDLRCVRIPVSWCRFAFCTPCERPFLGEQGSKLAVGKSPRISTIFLLYIRDKSPRIYKTNSSRQISSDF